MIDRERAESETERRRFDVKRYIPSALRSQDKTVRSKLEFFSKINFRFLATTCSSIRCSILYNEKNSDDFIMSTGKQMMRRQTRSLCVSRT